MQNPSPSRSPWKFISMVLLLILIGMITSAIVFWVFEAKKMRLHWQNKTLALAQTVDTLQATLANQQNALENLQQKVEQPAVIHQTTPFMQTLSPISYLIYQANLHLSLNQEIITTLKILSQASQLISASNDVRFSDLQKAMSIDIAALKKVSARDPAAIIIQIDTTSENIQSLDFLPPQTPVVVSDTTEPVGKFPQNWKRLIQITLNDLKKIFIIHTSEPTFTQALTIDQQALLKQVIQMKLEQTEWALLNHNNTLYQHNIKEVSTWISSYYAASEKRDAILQQLNTLRLINAEITLPTLDNTLNALQRLLVSESSTPSDDNATKNNAKTPVKNNRFEESVL